MYKIRGYGTDIDINLENGIYLFYPGSATGKTYLYNLFVQIVNDANRVLGYTYTDYKRGINLCDILKSNKFNVILLDRYDMYRPVYDNLIKDISKNSIVLLDCKLNQDIGLPFDNCHINLTEQKIEVYTNDME